MIFFLGLLVTLIRSYNQLLDSIFVLPLGVDSLSEGLDFILEEHNFFIFDHILGQQFRCELNLLSFFLLLLKLDVLLHELLLQSGKLLFEFLVLVL